jgi:hypothetical protein
MIVAITAAVLFVGLFLLAKNLDARAEERHRQLIEELRGAKVE